MVNNSSTPEKEEGAITKHKKEEIEKKYVRKRMSKKELMEEIVSLEETLSVEKEKSETYLRQLKYARADLENLRKRFEKDIENAVKTANERMIRQLLIILDDIKLALEVGNKTENNEAFIEGVEMVLKKFEKILSNEGLSPIEALGKPFNPKLHEAVMKVEAPDKSEGTIVEEIRKGYTLRGKVIRASMVKVSGNFNNMEKKREGDVYE